ncbi:MAG: VOC family protein [Thermoprotei archaeon]
MIKNLGSIAVVVSDAKKAAEWYTKTLGLELASSEGHWVTVKTKDSKTVIHLCQGPPLEPGNTGILFECDDIQKTYSELASRGVVFTKPPKDEGWGVYALFRDLDGNEFWLMKAE